MTEKERNAVFENTVGQASIQEWHDQRKGRLTASRFHQICTRSKSLQASSSTDADCLVSTLLGYNKAPNTAALKHGQSMEPHAKANYLSVAKKNHRKLVSSEAGLVIMPEKPFIAVSPDLLIECLCCGQGLVEIKCPYSIRGTTPSSSNLAYLEEIEGKTTLKKNSDYYYQIQGQMAVTGRAYTDLVVFTTHGNFIERINFYELFWLDMLIKLEWFWVNCLCPEVLYKTIKQQKDTVSQSLSASSTKCLPENENCGTTSSGSSTAIEIVSSVCLSKDSPLKPSRFTKSVLNHITDSSPVKSSPKKTKRETKATTRKKLKKNTTHIPVFPCGECQKDVPDVPEKFEEKSIECGACFLWFHFV